LRTSQTFELMLLPISQEQEAVRDRIIKINIKWSVGRVLLAFYLDGDTECRVSRPICREVTTHPLLASTLITKSVTLFPPYGQPDLLLGHLRVQDLVSNLEYCFSIESLL
jgi:hypothetical protein